jgi:hypothetical protein
MTGAVSVHSKMAATPTRRAFVCAVFALGMSLGGCAHVDKINADASARSDAAAPRMDYSIREISAPASPLPIDAAAGKKHVRTALAARGMVEASAPDKAGVEVTYGYNLRENRRTRTVSEPVYTSSPGGSYTETELGMDANGNMTSRTVTRNLPDVPFVDRTRDRQVTEVSFEKSLHLVAVEKKPTTPGVPPRVWDISISYEDTDGNMAKAMPLLAAAGCARIGTKTDGPITIRLRGKDEVVALINRGP